eukprot:TRINITY_DN38111_c0_g1_i1.p1 TRINITY_DN38111_c0_g1~~TRINITY_DN38111_c0_g1_i1.p1  ORF type:complete len:296 (+),score=27.22 TRINITY_DN38111_c0_g1_i1:73-960(+)
MGRLKWFHTAEPLSHAVEEAHGDEANGRNVTLFFAATPSMPSRRIPMRSIERTHFLHSTFLKLPGLQSIGCNASGADVHFVGPWARVICPTRCDRDTDAKSGAVFGSSIHPMTSPVCKSAIVDKVMPVYGGEVLLTRVPGLPAYTGKDAGEAISLGMSDEKGEAFHIYAIDTIDTTLMPAVKRLRCGATFASLNLKKAGESVPVECPEGCGGQGYLAGSFIYTPGSAVCHAAHHAGIIADGGGKVIVTRGHGQDAYFGSSIGENRSVDSSGESESYTVALPTPHVLSRAMKADFL